MKLKQSFVVCSKHNRDLYYDTWSQYQRADETQIRNAALTESGFQHVYRLELIAVQFNVLLRCV